MNRPVSNSTTRAILDDLKAHAEKHHGNRTNDSNFTRLFGMMNSVSDQAKALLDIQKNKLPNMSEDAHRAKVLKSASVTASKARESRATFEEFKATTEKIYFSNMVENSGLKFGPLAEETRKYALALPVTERSGLIQQLVTNKDGASLAALIHPSVPNFLTGLSATEQVTFRDQWFKTTIPAAVETKEAFKEMADHVNQTLLTAEKTAALYGNPASLHEIENITAAHAAADKKMMEA